MQSEPQDIVQKKSQILEFTAHIVQQTFTVQTDD